MKRTALVVALSLVTTLAFGTAAQATHDVTHVPITGTFEDPTTGATGTFEGTSDIERFVFRNGQILAVGTLEGTFTDTLGNTTPLTGERVRLPVQLNGDGATCTILTLDLGPLDLNLLGLHVHLDEVHLVIEAHEGEGLLGDLLCALSNAHNNGGSLRAVTQLLNQVLRVLG